MATLEYFTGDTMPILFEVKTQAGDPLAIPLDAVVSFSIRKQTGAFTAEIIAGPFLCANDATSTEVGNADWTVGKVVGFLDETTAGMELGRHRLELQVDKEGKRTTVAKQSIQVMEDTIT